MMKLINTFWSIKFELIEVIIGYLNVGYSIKDIFIQLRIF